MKSPSNISKAAIESPPDWDAHIRRLACHHNALQVLAKAYRWSFEFAHALASFKLLGMEGTNHYLPVHDEMGGAVVGRRLFRGQLKPNAEATDISFPLVIGDATHPAWGVQMYESPADAFALLHANGWNGEELECPEYVTFGRRLHPALIPKLAAAKEVTFWLDTAYESENGDALTQQWYEQVQSCTSGIIYVAKAPSKVTNFRGWSACLRRSGRQKTRWLSEDAIRQSPGWATLARLMGQQKSQDGSSAVTDCAHGNAVPSQSQPASSTINKPRSSVARDGASLAGNADDLAPR